MTPATTASLAGAADTGAFLAARPQLFREAPGRAAGSVAFLGLWLATAAATSRRQPGPGALALAATLLAGQAGMLAVHLRHGIAGPRVYAGAALAAVALGDTVRRR